VRVDDPAGERPVGTVPRVSRQRQGRSLAEDVHEALRSDIVLGRRAPGSRLPLNELAAAHGVSLSVVREAVTRLSSEGLVEATPQRGFRVRPISLEHLHDLTWMRTHVETLAVRESVERGDVSWEAGLVGAHHRLGATPMFLDDGTGNPAWMIAHGEFHTALAAGAGRPALERVRRRLYDESELYRTWSGTLPREPIRRHAVAEHDAICAAALARDADLAVRLVAEHLAATADALTAYVRQELPAAGEAGRAAG
jgi:DNA-binding GntR family transcriptional regulator